MLKLGAAMIHMHGGVVNRGVSPQRCRATARDQQKIRPCAWPASYGAWIRWLQRVAQPAVGREPIKRRYVCGDHLVW